MSAHKVMAELPDSPELTALLQFAREYVDSLTPEQRKDMHVRQRESYARSLLTTPRGERQAVAYMPDGETPTGTLAARAHAYASAAHAGQVRKYTGEPYINHPREVVMELRTAGIGWDTHPEAVAAAWLHDVVEDTPATIEDIQRQFGDTVAHYVLWMTEASHPLHGNRALRKRLDADVFCHAPAMAQSIKLADIISNTRSIVEHDPKFARTYLQEKHHLLTEVLVSPDANEYLYETASAIVSRARMDLGLVG